MGLDPETLKRHHSERIASHRGGGLGGFADATLNGRGTVRGRRDGRDLKIRVYVTYGVASLLAHLRNIVVPLSPEDALP